MRQVTVEEAQTRLPELLRAMTAGEEIHIVREGGVVARLIRTQPPPRADRPLGTAKGKIVLADDFDAPLEDFKDYM